MVCWEIQFVISVPCQHILEVSGVGLFYVIQNLLSRWLMQWGSVNCAWNCSWCPFCNLTAQPSEISLLFVCFCKNVGHITYFTNLQQKREYGCNSWLSNTVRICYLVILMWMLLEKNNITTEWTNMSHFFINGQYILMLEDILEVHYKSKCDYISLHFIMLFGV